MILAKQSAFQVGMATTPAIQKGAVTHVVTVVEFLRLTKHPIPGGWSSNRYSDTVDEILLLIWGWVKTLVPLVNPKIAGIYGCSSH